MRQKNKEDLDELNAMKNRTVISAVYDDRMEGLANGQKPLQHVGWRLSKGRARFPASLFFNNLPNFPIALLVCHQDVPLPGDCL
jgi:hypothetical protein